MNTTPDTPTPRALRELTPLEARILGVLVEKQHTVPDTYPLSLNALTAGCNQKTARAPVMNVSEDEVTTALDELKRLSLVMEGSSSRVPRFEHNMNRVLGIPSQAIALLTILLLRGPQTAAELRLNSARLHGFADISSVEAFLDELAARAAARRPAAACAGCAREPLDAPDVRRREHGRLRERGCRRRRGFGAAFRIRGAKGRTEAPRGRSGATQCAGSTDGERTRHRRRRTGRRVLIAS
uniref:UPF0502 protein Bcen_5249 n=1 Tax=Burkholderia orbicola (strain AU 1054) TaxID=331271 RepID=Y5249_BURO1|nr:RecName: Full=UPF0502 protein Bcen_5249 [Burkholderia orbicola AU 1054]